MGVGPHTSGNNIGVGVRCGRGAPQQRAFAVMVAGQVSREVATVTPLSKPLVLSPVNNGVPTPLHTRKKLLDYNMSKATGRIDCVKYLNDWDTPRSLQLYAKDANARAIHLTMNMGNTGRT